MMLRLLITVTALTAVMGGPALSQQQSNPHRYVSFFKYSSAAMKAMTETPQDRSVGARQLAEGVGGKVDSIYFLPLGGEYDGFVIWELPDELAAMASINMTTKATGAFERLEAMPIMNGEQFKAVMEKTKQLKGGYSPPTPQRHRLVSRDKVRNWSKFGLPPWRPHVARGRPDPKFAFEAGSILRPPPFS